MPTTGTRIAEFIANEMKIDTKLITRETAFDDVGVDSLDVQELIFALEEAEDIVIDQGEIQHVQSIGDFLDVVIAKVDAKSQQPA